MQLVEFSRRPVLHEKPADSRVFALKELTRAATVIQQMTRTTLLALLEHGERLPAS